MKEYVQSHLKEMNRLKVYSEIRRLGITSKAELARSTGISSPTVMKIVNYLVEQGLVEEIGAAETAIGRRPTMIRLNTKLMYNLCFVIEGDFLNMGVVDILEEVLYVKSARIVPDYDHIMHAITDRYIDELLQESGIDASQLVGIGIAFPAVYDLVNQMISNSPFMNLMTPRCIQQEIDVIAEKYRILVIVENDTNAQALGEFHLRENQKLRDMLFFSSGTGMGAGIILDGKLRRGASYRCGELGDILLDSEIRDDTLPIGMEYRFGLRKLQELYGENLISHPELLPKEVRENLLEYMTVSLARVLYNLDACMDFDQIVLGGKVVETLGGELLDCLNKKLKKLKPSFRCVQMETSKNVGIIGLAWLLTNKKIKQIIAKDSE